MPIPQPTIEYEVVPEPTPVVPEPIIEQDPLDPNPNEWRPYTPPDPEPVPEPVIEPVIEPEPDPVLERDPLDPNPNEWRPYIPPEPEPEPEPIEEPPIAGAVIEPIEPETIEPEPLPSIPEDVEITPDPEPAVIENTEPEERQPDEPEFITTAPTILASPEAPTTIEEADRAIPQSQAAPVANQPRGSGAPSNQQAGGANAPNLGGPSRGGGNLFGGGTQRSSPGASGWTLAPGSYGNSPGAGYQGLNLDIRCREADRTHEDCPEYLRQFQGRNSGGFESFGAHSTGGTPTRSARAGTQSNQSVGGGTNPWDRGIGSNSINAGGPSESILDDADFGRTFLSTPLGDGTAPGRLTDIFEEPREPWNEPKELEDIPTEPITLDGN